MILKQLNGSERKQQNTHAYMTDAPPPATMVQMRPAEFKMVSFRDAPLLASRSAMYASYQHQHSTCKHTNNTRHAVACILLYMRQPIAIFSIQVSKIVKSNKNQGMQSAAHGLTI